MDFHITTVSALYTQLNATQYTHALCMRHTMQAACSLTLAPPVQGGLPPFILTKIPLLIVKCHVTGQATTPPPSHAEKAAEHVRTTT